MKKLIAVMLLMTILFTSCTAKPEETLIVQDFSIYYALKGNTGLGKEIREIQYKDNNELYKKLLEEYFKGPQDKEAFEWGYEATPRVLQIMLSNGDATINLTSEFNRFSGALDEAGKVASLVNTFLQMEEVKRVKLLIEGREFIGPSGEPYGFMTYIDFTTTEYRRDLTLYFADSQAMYVVAEKRSVNMSEEALLEELCRKVIEELIAGPSVENLYRTIPEEAKVLSVRIDKDIARIDFSREMITKHSRGAAGEDMTLNSIVNSLTELEGVKGVLLTVDGRPMNIEHVVVTEPLERNETKIYRQ